MMLCKLYINNELYRTIEGKDKNSYRSEIQWAAPATMPMRRSQFLPPLVNDEFKYVTFRHCGYGFYHCHVSERLERAIRKLDKYPSK
jgi:hypothetical protein